MAAATHTSWTAVQLITVIVLLSHFTAVSPHGLPRPFQLPPTPSNVVTRSISYQCDGKTYEGFAAIPSTTRQARPGVLIGHTWTGLGPMEQYRAAQVASKLGFVAFALDVYGTGVRPTTQAAAKIEMNKVLSNLTDFHRRVECGMSQLMATTTPQGTPNGAHVNASLLFANGYCFGGVMVLELARRGKYPSLKAVSSFHGELGNLTSQSTDRVSAVVQVHHADLDFQGAAGLLLFEDEMRSQNVSHWSTTKYGQVSHGWTDPTSENYRKFEADQAHNNMFSLYTQILEVA